MSGACVPVFRQPSSASTPTAEAMGSSTRFVLPWPSPWHTERGIRNDEHSFGFIFDALR
jgi:hypothetical protein